MENNKTPTASEFLPKNNNGKYSRNEVEKAMIEFAKLHVEAALKAASKKAQCEDGAIVDLGFEIISASVDKDSILNSYSLNNIK